jgi:hypothetical protein
MFRFLRAISTSVLIVQSASIAGSHRRELAADFISFRYLHPGHGAGLPRFA